MVILDGHTLDPESVALVAKGDEVRLGGEARAAMAANQQTAAAAARVEAGDDVAVVRKPTSLNELCHMNFANTVTESVDFRQSSAEVRTSSHSLLDRIIDIANDCRAYRIAITGHSDASGDENRNRKLSRARAQAVADYLVRGGIQPQRLIVDGVGSAEPVADNATPHFASDSICYGHGAGAS